MDVVQDRAASKADRCNIVSTLNTWWRCIQMPSTLTMDLVHRRWRKRIIHHGYVMWAVQHRRSTFYYQCMRLLTKEHNKLLCSLELSDTSHWRIYEKYNNGIVSWQRRISGILYPIQDTVHHPLTKNVIEIHRLPSTIRSNFRRWQSAQQRMTRRLRGGACGGPWMV